MVIGIIGGLMSAVFVTGSVDLPLVIGGSGIGIVLEIIVGYGVIVFAALGNAQCRCNNRGHTGSGENVVGGFVCILAGHNALALGDVGAVHLSGIAAAVVCSYSAVVGKYYKEGILKISKLVKTVVNSADLNVCRLEGTIIFILLISGGVALMIDAVEMNEGHHRVVFFPVVDGEICNSGVGVGGLEVYIDVVFDNTVVNGAPVYYRAESSLGIGISDVFKDRRIGLIIGGLVGLNAFVGIAVALRTYTEKHRRPVLCAD